jgi:ABC-2 type transport system ATP-binding protein
MFGPICDTPRPFCARNSFSTTFLPQALTVEENSGDCAAWSVSDPRAVDNIEGLEMGELAIKRVALPAKPVSGWLRPLTELKILPSTSRRSPTRYRTRFEAFKEERRSSGLSVLYTSHNMHEMEEMTDRIIFLQRGKIVAEGTAQEIVARFGQGDLEEVFVKLAREK